MAKDKKEKQKKKASQFEKDERRYFIFAAIICVIVVLVVMIALFAIYRHKRGGPPPVVENQVEETTETETDTGGYSQDGSIVVINQQELDQALADPRNLEILFQTEESVAITIPAGNYPELSLIIDAPYADVFNYAKYKSVTINRISSNTWTENTTGNSFYISAVSSHLIIAERAEVERIELSQSNSTLAIENAGKIEMITLAADSTIVSIDDNKTIESVVISKKTNLNLLGKATEPVQMDIGYDADGTVINTTIPLNIKSYGSVTLDCQEGAESTTLAMKNNTKTTVVSNHTTEDMTVEEASGTQTTIAKGTEDKRFEGTETEMVTSSSTSSSSTTTTSSTSGTRTYSTNGSSGGSSSSSKTGVTANTSISETTSASSTTTTETKETKETKETSETKESEKIYSQSEVDKKIADAIDKNTADTNEKIAQAIDEIMRQQPITINQFENLPKYEAGVYGNAKTTDVIYKELAALHPKIKGYGSSPSDVVEFQIRGWIPDQNYSPTAPPGTYVFYAWLGSSSVDCTITSTAVASIEIYIKSYDGIVYSGDDAKSVDVMKLKAVNGNIENIEEYYIATNHSDKLLEVRFNIYYYYLDNNGELQMDHQGSANPVYLQPGDTEIFEKYNQSGSYKELIDTVIEIDASPPPLAIVEKYKMEKRDLLFDQETNLIVSEFYTPYEDARVYENGKPKIRFGFGVTINHPSIKKKMSEVQISILYLNSIGEVIEKESYKTGDRGDFFYRSNGEIQRGLITLPSVTDFGTQCEIIFTYPEGCSERNSFYIFTSGGYEIKDDG